MKTRFIVAAAAMVLAVCVSVFSRQVPGERVIVDFYGSPGCPTCVAALDFIGSLSNEASIDLRYHNTGRRAEYDRLLATLAAHGIDPETVFSSPVIFVGQAALIGFHRDDIVAAVRGFSPDAHAAIEAAVQEELRSRDRIVPSVLVVLFAGLVDGVNPCAFVTLMFLVSLYVTVRRTAAGLLRLCVGFAVGISVMYLALGLVMFEFVDYLTSTSKVLASVLYSVGAPVALVFCVLSFRDAVVLRRRGQPTVGLGRGPVSRIHMRLREAIERSHDGLIVSAGIGAVIGLIEFACTGQVYLPTILYLTSAPGAGMGPFLLLIAYNLAFVLPLIVCGFLASRGYALIAKQRQLASRRSMSVLKAATGTLMGLFSILLAVMAYRSI